MSKLLFSILLFSPVYLFSQVELSGDGNEEVKFAIIEEIPVFPGCEEVDRKDRNECFDEKIKEHVKANLKYPKKALRRNIQGMVSVQFIIDKEGNVTDIRTIGADPILESEARRIFSLLPKMKPGFQKGKPVMVKYGVPLTFKIQ
ncbi:energy transducer TonB [Flavobacterium sp.]|jgi:protein TonB|uniref:energy transducer TonB n=1 Tax=Flavobacterium sp. TaxID=239 RepID=UPI002A8114DE|nr:energy transducer TonB [Flavobacterium sp.]